MEKSEPKRTRKFRGRSVSTIAIGNTYELASRWIDILRGRSPRSVAKRIGASPRTVENWQDGANGPTWKHTVAMLHDDELGPMVLKAAGLDELAKQHEIMTLNRRIEALKAAEARHQEDAHEIRRDLEIGRSRVPLDGGSLQQHGDAIPTTRRVVSGSTD
jgi:hypothetical protein